MKGAILFALFGLTSAYSQSLKLGEIEVDAVNVSTSVEKMTGRDAMRAIKAPSVKEFDEPTFAKVKGIEFRNGTIELKVLSRLSKDAPDFARGFIGVAFRINNDNSRFECIYIRPTNGRTDDQLRRNRSIQYFAYPDFKFERLRKEAAGVYEAYADMGLDEWIAVRIEVRGRQAKLFLNDNQQPSLVVNDLKHGADASGAIGLWVDIGTVGFFTDLKVRAERFSN